MTFYTYFQSPLGQLTIQANAQGLSGLWMQVQKTQPQQLGEYSEKNQILQKAVKQLQEYFDSKRKIFALEIAVEGTDFQKTVWQALTEIPYGSAWSYQDLASHIDKPKAARAVGAANGKNPLSIIVPCHRVVGKSGALTGYAGGVKAKQWLLEHENIA